MARPSLDNPHPFFTPQVKSINVTNNVEIAQSLNFGSVHCWFRLTQWTLECSDYTVGNKDPNNEGRKTSDCKYKWHPQIKNWVPEQHPERETDVYYSSAPEQREKTGIQGEI
jgi:hypothetical protein